MFKPKVGGSAQKELSDMEINHPFVSIITVNYNNTVVTGQLLESLKKIAYVNFEVIVVDNASNENPTEELKKIFPEAKVILSNENLGFAGGNNLGIAHSRGEFLFFLNNDTELQERTINYLIERLQSDESIGVVSPKIVYFDQPSIIQYAGFTEINPITARNSTIGFMAPDNGKFDLPMETSFAHGAAMMMSREVVEKVGKMPEEYFLYYEELDWCEKIKRAGYKIFYEPKSVILHKESMSVGKESPSKTYYLTRNRILFMRRNYPGVPFFIFIVYFALVALPKNIVHFMILLKLQHVKSIFKGLAWNLKINSK